MININKNDYDSMKSFMNDFFLTLKLEIIKLSLYNHFKNEMNKELNLSNHNIYDIVELIIINNVDIYYWYNRYYKFYNLNIIDFNNEKNNLYIDI